MSHHNVVHKTIPTPTAMNMIEAKAALDKEWTKLEKLPEESKFISQAEVIRRAKIGRQDSSCFNIHGLVSSQEF